MKKMECPICKKKVLFVGVHDDEGNYHGLVGCEYENDPWSGLSYALHHEGWGDCPMCTDGAYSTMGGMLFDTAEDAISALTPRNKPMTIEQLRGMDGEPVWGKSLITDKPGEWFIVRVVEMSKAWFIACAGATQGFGDKDTYGTTWLAYRRPPEEET